MNILKSLFISAIILASAASAGAQAMFINSARMSPDPAAMPDTAISVSDSLLNVAALNSDDIFDMPMTLPDVFFTPPVYDRYTFFTPLSINEKVHSGTPGMQWLEDYEVLKRQMLTMRHDLYYNHPDLVKYNLDMLPSPPPVYEVVLDPADYTITLRPVEVQPEVATLDRVEVKKRHWLRTFSASLQFSQAYVSPNWYQGGNNNLNALGQLYYNVKLNETFHPNLMFETTAQYKLGMNNAPDDSIHAYNISDDMLQINTTFGVKAVKNWYYSFTGQFKTQLLNSYKSNTHDLVSSLLSPGELTAGVGMTYNHQNKAKTFSFNASIAPVSYNLKTCISSHINPETYGIEEGHKSVSKFGSTAEFKLAWKICRNIAFSSRLFAFTDYESFQADWENTLAFEINRFLTTQIYAHLRYDTRTPYVEDTNWKKLQVKEIFSIGFAYKFATV